MSQAAEPQSDLIVLVPDIAYEKTLGALLARHAALGIRPISFDIERLATRDPGCLKEAPTFLRRYLSTYHRALVIFDMHGAGGSVGNAAATERSVAEALARSGWDDRAAVVIVDPELEAWVWSDSPHVARCLGWTNQKPPLRAWLLERGLWPNDQVKPPDPQKAMREALRCTRKPMSSDIFADLAEHVSVRRCTDPAFSRLTDILTRWFPAQ